MKKEKVIKCDPNVSTPEGAYEIFKSIFGFDRVIFNTLCKIYFMCIREHEETAAQMVLYSVVKQMCEHKNETNDTKTKTILNITNKNYMWLYPILSTIIMTIFCANFIEQKDEKFIDILHKYLHHTKVNPNILLLPKDRIKYTVYNAIMKKMNVHTDINSGMCVNFIKQYVNIREKYIEYFSNPSIMYTVNGRSKSENFSNIVNRIVQEVVSCIQEDKHSNSEIKSNNDEISDQNDEKLDMSEQKIENESTIEMSKYITSQIETDSSENKIDVKINDYNMSSSLDVIEIEGDIKNLDNSKNVENIDVGVDVDVNVEKKNDLEIMNAEIENEEIKPINSLLDTENLNGSRFEIEKNELDNSLLDVENLNDLEKNEHDDSQLNVEKYDGSDNDAIVIEIEIEKNGHNESQLNIEKYYGQNDNDNNQYKQHNGEYYYHYDNKYNDNDNNNPHYDIFNPHTCTRLDNKIINVNVFKNPNDLIGSYWMYDGTSCCHVWVYSRCDRLTMAEYYDFCVHKINATVDGNTFMKERYYTNNPRLLNY